MTFWFAFSLIAVAFVLSTLATPVARQLAERYRILDRPAKHKAHAKPTALLGGCAIFFAIAMPLVGSLALVRYWAATGIPDWLPGQLRVHVPGAAARAPQALGILIGAAVLHVLGLVDDRRHLGAWLKLVVHAAVAAAVVGLCNVRVLTVLGPTTSFILTVLWIVVITNAFNFLDNMDGLSVGVACICAAALFGGAAGMGQFFVSAWLCLLAGALLGFLPHNFPPARIFMGDGGSIVVGYLLAVLSCLTTYVRLDGPQALHGVFAPLVLMAVPLYDMISVIVIRVREGRNPMIGDTRHFSHRLVRRGMTTRRALLTIYLCTSATAIAATLLPHVANRLGAILVFLQSVIILMIVALLETDTRKP